MTGSPSSKDHGTMTLTGETQYSNVDCLPGGALGFLPGGGWRIFASPGGEGTSEEVCRREPFRKLG